MITEIIITFNLIMGSLVITSIGVYIVAMFIEGVSPIIQRSLFTFAWLYKLRSKMTPEEQKTIQELFYKYK